MNHDLRVRANSNTYGSYLKLKALLSDVRFNDDSTILQGRKRSSHHFRAGKRKGPLFALSVFVEERMSGCRFWCDSTAKL